jgi:hypothetical protein
MLLSGIAAKRAFVVDPEFLKREVPAADPLSLPDAQALSRPGFGRRKTAFSLRRAKPSPIPCVTAKCGFRRRDAIDFSGKKTGHVAVRRVQREFDAR